LNSYVEICRFRSKSIEYLLTARPLLRSNRSRVETGVDEHSRIVDQDHVLTTAGINGVDFFQNRTLVVEARRFGAAPMRVKPKQGRAGKRRHDGSKHALTRSKSEINVRTIAYVLSGRLVESFVGFYGDDVVEVPCGPPACIPHVRSRLDKRA